MDGFPEWAGTAVFLAVIIVAVFFALKGRARSTRVLSIFADKDDLSDQGFAAFRLFSRGSSAPDAKGRQEFLPSWGVIIGVPFAAIVAFLLIANSEAGSHDGFFGDLTSPEMLGMLGLALSGVIYTWVFLAFAHRVTITDNKITVVDEFFRKKTAALSDLDSISALGHNPFYALRFDDGQTLKVSRFISHRNDLLELLKRQIAQKKYGNLRFHASPKINRRQPDIDSPFLRRLR